MSIKRERLSPEESRAAALEAARRLLIEKGPQAVTLKAVAAEIGKTVREPSVREKLLKAGVDPLGISTQQFVEFLKREHNTYSKIAAERSIRVD